MSKDETEKHLQKLVDKLSKRERDVLASVLQGFSNTEIGDAFGIANATAKIHRANVYRKLKVNSLSEVFKLFRVQSTLDVEIET